MHAFFALSIAFAKIEAYKRAGFLNNISANITSVKKTMLHLACQIKIATVAKLSTLNLYLSKSYFIIVIIPDTRRDKTFLFFLDRT